MKIVQGIPKKYRKPIITWSYSYFKEHINKINFNYIIEQETNWDISAMLLDDSDDVVGIYLLGNGQLSDIINSNKYKDLKGVEGVLLLIDEDIRGEGWGDKLKDYPKTLGLDYIWGQQLKSLNNLDHWLKRREFISETEFIYITAEFFNK